MPDVIGLDLKNAVKMLEKEGIKISRIKVTAPPRYQNNDYKDYFRVLRVDITGDREVEILICDPCTG